MLRTFVAVRCGTAVAARLRAECRRLAGLDRALRPPGPDDFHLTLQFLGDTREADLPRIAEVLRRAAAAVEPFGVRYSRLGAFPGPERARVVWVAGEEEGGRAGAFADLARRVGEGLSPLGYPPEARTFHPHVTLGRLRAPPGAALVAALRGGAGAPEAGGPRSGDRETGLGAETVSEVRHILSDPSGTGYRYVDLTTVRLGAGVDRSVVPGDPA
jgi:2'-5' RNA ligase